MTTSARHERFKDLILRLIHEFARIKGLVVESAGGTTIKRNVEQQGGEPDTCFYVQSAPQIIGKLDLDLAVHPPDVVVDVEIFQASERANEPRARSVAAKRDASARAGGPRGEAPGSTTEKWGFYASLGVPELWRYDQRRLQMLRLTEGQYVEVPESLAFPSLSADLLTRLLEQSQSEGQTAAVAALAGALGPGAAPA
jgi:Uma2 family endonuclease